MSAAAKCSAASPICIPHRGYRPLPKGGVPDSALTSLNQFSKSHPQLTHQQNRRIAELSSYLRSIRQSYLSITQPPKRKQIQRTNSSTLSSPHGLERKYLTDRQRSDIDTETKQLIRELNAGIKGLLDVEQHRQQTEASVALRKRARRGLGALGRWAAGGAITAKSPQEELEEAKANTLKVHRESVVWYLGSHLEECSRYQASMMEIRLQREVEKNKSVLYKTHTTAFSAGSHPEMNGAMSASLTSKNKEPHWNSQKPSVDELERDGQQSTTSSGQQLSPEQLQLFAEENQDMLKQYEDSLDQVRCVRIFMISRWVRS